MRGVNCEGPVRTDPGTQPVRLTPKSTAVLRGGCQHTELPIQRLSSFLLSVKVSYFRRRWRERGGRKPCSPEHHTESGPKGARVLFWGQKPGGLVMVWTKGGDRAREGCARKTDCRIWSAATTSQRSEKRRRVATLQKARLLAATIK